MVVGDAHPDLVVLTGVCSIAFWSASMRVSEFVDYLLGEGGSPWT